MSLGSSVDVGNTSSNHGRAAARRMKV